MAPSELLTLAQVGTAICDYQEKINFALSKTRLINALPFKFKVNQAGSQHLHLPWEIREYYASAFSSMTVSRP